MTKKIIGYSWSGKREFTHSGNNILNKIIKDADGNVYTITKINVSELENDASFYRLLCNSKSVGEIMHWYDSGEWIVCGFQGQCERTNDYYLQAIVDYLAAI